MNLGVKWSRVWFVVMAYLMILLILPIHSHSFDSMGLLHSERKEWTLDESGSQSRGHNKLHNLFGDEEQLLEEQINYGLPSMTVILVQDGETLVSVTRGLYHGQLNEGVGMFDVGSLSRLTTSLALLELMNQKGIKLEDEIGNYIPEPLRKHQDGIYQKIRFVDLLTHTTGFVNHRFGTASYNAFAISSKERAMKHLLSRGTQQLFSPGKVSMYSNVSHTLAGILIEELSKTSFETYMKHYFEKIGMQSSHIVEELQSDSVGHRYYVDGGNVTPAPDYYALLPSADSLVTTPEDMTALLRKLTNGSFPRPFRLFESVFSNSRFTSRSTAFNIVEYRGRKLYMLDGSLPGAFSRIAMIPEWNAAFFLYYNSDSVDARETLTHALIAGMDQQFQQDLESSVSRTHEETAQSQLSREDKSQVRRLAGDYKTLNYSSATPESISAFAHQLRINEVDGGLMIGQTFYLPVNANEKNANGNKMEEKHALRFDVFYSEKADEHIEFKTDDRNRFTYVVIGNEFYTGAFSSTVQITILTVLGIVLFLLLIRIIRRWNVLHTGRVDDRPRVLVLFYCILMLGLLVLTGLAIRECTYWGIAYGGGWALATLRIVGWLCLPALVLLTWAVVSTRGDYKWRGMTTLLMYLAIPLNFYLLSWLFTYRLLLM